MRPLILGTAGHIDHGKTTLVKALTGVDTDRLPEEKARGITIDLGFALLELGDMRAGIVDVPGHEGLIRNMLAGATGFDAVMLVVAADEGIMPQTREHLQIVRLLGIDNVVTAITKSDLVDAEWLELVRSDVRALLNDAGLGDAPVIAVSASTGAGIDRLRAILAERLAVTRRRADDDLFRMPVDRVFTVHGTGTIVTGTVWSGSAARDDAAMLLPGGQATRIRSIQTHGRAVDRAAAGERAAFALVGVDRTAVARGHVLVRHDGWREAAVLTTRVHTLDAPLKTRQRVRVHLGTAEVMARVVLLEDAWIQLRLEAPLLARVGDRFVLRAYSPVRTMGGGVVAEVGRARKRIEHDLLPALNNVLDGAAHDRLSAALLLAGADGISAQQLPVCTGLTPPEVDRALRALGGDVVRFSTNCFAADIVNAAAARIGAVLQAYHEQHPLKPGMERAELLNALPHPLNEAALLRALANRAITVQGSLVALTGYGPTLTAAQNAVQDRLLGLIRAGGLAPPGVTELAQATGTKDVRGLLRLLESAGQVTPISQELYLDSATLAAAVQTVRNSLTGRALAPADFRIALPVSRKYLIPLLEYLDRVGVTRREGDLRRIEAVTAPESA